MLKILLKHFAEKVEVCSKLYFCLMGTFKQTSTSTSKYIFENLDFMKRFLDDILKIFIGSVQDLHRIFDEISSIHPSIKFTMSHTSLFPSNGSFQCKCPYKDLIPF